MPLQVYQYLLVNKPFVGNFTESFWNLNSILAADQIKNEAVQVLATGLSNEDKR